jgi:hypothetical protein
MVEWITAIALTFIGLSVVIAGIVHEVQKNDK